MLADKIKNNLTEINVKNLLYRLGAKSIESNGIEIRSTCPIHLGDNPSAFKWRLDNNLWFCHTGCLSGGDIFDLIALKYDLDKSNFREIIIKTCELLGIDYTSEELNSIKDRNEKETRNFVSNMLKKLNKKENEPFNLKTLGSHFKLKKYDIYTEKSIEEHKITFVKELDRVCFPIQDENGEIVGASLRTIKDEKPKWLHRPKTIRTGCILYNLNNIKGLYETVYIVEGIGDCIALKQLGIDNVVATFGANIHEEQIKLLLRYFLNINLMYDNDKAGEAATKKFIDMCKLYFNIRVADLTSIGVNDPKEITSVEMLSKVRFFSVYQYLN